MFVTRALHLEGGIVCRWVCRWASRFLLQDCADARTEAGRRKVMTRAERALRLAAGDPELAEACERLQTLVAETKALA